VEELHKILACFVGKERVMKMDSSS
jgi:hypothetical protein